MTLNTSVVLMILALSAQGRRIAKNVRRTQMSTDLVTTKADDETTQAEAEKGQTDYEMAAYSNDSVSVATEGNYAIKSAAKATQTEAKKGQVDQAIVASNNEANLFATDQDIAEKSIAQAAIASQNDGDFANRDRHEGDDGADEVMKGVDLFGQVARASRNPNVQSIGKSLMAAAGLAALYPAPPASLIVAGVLGATGSLMAVYGDGGGLSNADVIHEMKFGFQQINMKLATIQEKVEELHTFAVHKGKLQKIQAKHKLYLRRLVAAQYYPANLDDAVAIAQDAQLRLGHLVHDVLNATMVKRYLRHDPKDCNKAYSRYQEVISARVGILQMVLHAQAAKHRAVTAAAEDEVELFLTQLNEYDDIINDFHVPVTSKEYERCLNYLRPIHTASNAGGGGLSYYIDRHHLQCGKNRVMTQWRLQRPAPDRIKFEYRCGRFPVRNCVHKSTPPNADGGGAVFYFDRHNLDCGGNRAMQSWRLSGRTKFDYQCCSLLAKMGPCFTDSTTFSDDGSGKSYYLDRHDVDCAGWDQVLTQWRLSRDRSHRNIRIDYRCCVVQ